MNDDPVDSGFPSGNDFGGGFDGGFGGGGYPGPGNGEFQNTGF